MKLDRRTLIRYDLSLPARIRSEGGHSGIWSEGQTRDLSVEGVYLRAQVSVPVGSRVEMYLALPEIFTSGEKLFIHAFGNVLRVEQAKPVTQVSVGVAAMIERYDITRG